MEFIGRVKELKTLEKEYRRESAFVVICGRRRVGKTTLIRKFLEGKKAYYYLATEEPEAMCMERFSSMLSRATGNPVFRNAHFSDWIDLFSAFASLDPGERKILVIDEFPYLVKNNSAFPSIMQQAWDEVLKDSNTMLILSGSLLGMMKKYALEASSPLYGRRTAQIDLDPLSFMELHEHEKGDFNEAVLRYSLTGGVPKYEELLAPYGSFSDILEMEFLNTNGFFFEEPYLMFKDEVNSTITYFGILKAIASGNHKSGDIASAFNAKTEDISPYLTTLRNLNVVERRVPITEKYPEKSRKGLYYIKDNFLKFWFRYIFPYCGDIEMDSLDGIKGLLKRDFVSGFLSFCYEDISADIFKALCIRGEIDFSPSRIGRYWLNNRNIDVEIDVIATDITNGCLFAGECKWYESPVESSVFEKLEEKILNSSEISSAYPGWKVLYGVFSHSGFTPELLELARRRGDILLIDKDKIVS